MGRESSMYNRILAMIAVRLQGLRQAEKKAKTADMSDNDRCDEDKNENGWRDEEV